MFSREQILKRPTYHLTGMGIDLFNALISHLYPGLELPPPDEPLPKIEAIHLISLAEKCEVSYHTMKTIAEGDFNGSLTKLVKVCVALGIAPKLTFTSLEKC